MGDPFKSIDKAFEPMMTEEVVVVTPDGQRQTIKAFVAVDNTGDPLCDEMMDTDREDINVTARAEDWYTVTKLERGAKLERPQLGNKKYAVQDVVMDSIMGLIVKARSEKR